jgi:hypothetical protein
MAKFAKIGYGSDGRGVGKTIDEDPEGYTYVVNDNVRNGAVLQVVATSRKQRKFATTGNVLHLFGQNTVKGVEAQADALANGREPINAYTGKELGAKGLKARPEQGSERFGVPSEFQKSARAGALGKYIQQHPEQAGNLTKNAQETYDSYSKKFIKKGE